MRSSSCGRRFVERKEYAMDWKPTCDAIVTFPDALRWVEPLIKAKPDDVITHALNVEPAVLGVAADPGRRACERLGEYGANEEDRGYIFQQCTLAGAKGA